MVSFDYLFDVVFHVRWPLYIALYIFFTGMSAGSFMLSTLGAVFGIRQFKPLSRIGVVIALILLVVALLFLIIDLEQPLKAYTTLYRTNPDSVMTWGVYLLTIYPVNCVVYAWFIFRADFVRLAKLHARSPIKKAFYSLLALEQKDLSAESIKRDGRYSRFFGILGVPLALMVSGYSGFVLAVVEASVLWHTALMPPLFLASTMVSGIALFIIVYAIYTRYFSRDRNVDKKTLRSLSVLMAWAMIVDLTLLLCEVIVLSNAGTAAQDAVWLLTQGPLAGIFIGVEILLGAFIPVLIIFVPATGKRIWGQILASVLILMGILAMRFNIIVGGQFIPLAGGEIVRYNITGTEVENSVMIVCLGAILVYIAFRVLPLQPLKGERDREDRTGEGPEQIQGNVEAASSGMDRRAFLRAAIAVGGLLAGAQLGLVGLRDIGSPVGAAEASGAPAKGNVPRYAMVIDLTKCIGCHSCTQACKETYDLPVGAWRCWVTKIKRTDGRNEKDLFLPRLCNQCEHPPCVKVCPVQATYKNENGLVVQRYDRCIGCKYCMMACPYNMRYVHPKLKVVDKCTFCDHRVKNGLEPACVAACPPRARIFGDLNDNTSEVTRLVTTMPTTVLKPDLGTAPRVFYIGADKDLEEARIHARK
jgi:tetrathionate reductase subunit C